VGKFDPSRFIQAERERSQLSQPSHETVAAVDTFAGADKDYDFRRFRAERAETVAKSQLSQPPGDEFPWSAGLVTLQDLRRPIAISEKTWDRMVWLALDLSAKWGRQALDLGWTPLELFGCHSNPLARRVDRDGLAISLAKLDTELTDITTTHAAMRDRCGSVLKYYRMARDQRAFLWEAFAFPSGP
jgi:hypothetical protein